MASDAPDSVALGLKLEYANERIGDIRQFLALAQKLSVVDQFPDLPSFLMSQLAKAESERLDLLNSISARAPKYEVSVTAAAEALGVSENTIRKWDVEGCPSSSNYPGRFASAAFYQWTCGYQTMKNFNREAKKHAMHMNSL